MMMGATLNPGSDMAEVMDTELRHDLQAHSIYYTSMQPKDHKVHPPCPSFNLTNSSCTTNRSGTSCEHYNSESCPDNDKLWMMMGATLNPDSVMAEEMNTELKGEVQAHSIYYTSMQPKYHQVPLPRRKRRRAKKSYSSASSSTESTNDESELSASNKAQHLTLDGLLDKQWDQGYQFLVDYSLQHTNCDIASTLSSLHKLKEENRKIRSSLNRMVQKRDRLRASKASLFDLSTTTVPDLKCSGDQKGR